MEGTDRKKISSGMVFRKNFEDLSSEMLHTIFEGGNIFGTGSGVCLSTSRLFKGQLSWESETYREPRLLDNVKIRVQVLQKMMPKIGCHTWIFTEAPQQETTGHMDTFIGQLANDTFVVGWQDVHDDPFNSLVLDHVRRQLQRLSKRLGLNIRGFPMPPRFSPGQKLATLKIDEVAREIARESERRRACWFLDEKAEPKCTFDRGDCCSLRHRYELPPLQPDGGVRWRWRSYTNLLQVHHKDTHAVFVPSFRVEGTKLDLLKETDFARRIVKYETAVNDTLKAYFTEVVWINQEERVFIDGSIHCLTKQVPVGSPLICPSAGFS